MINCPIEATIAVCVEISGSGKVVFRVSEPKGIVNVRRLEKFVRWRDEKNFCSIKASAYQLKSSGMSSGSTSGSR